MDDKQTDPEIGLIARFERTARNMRQSVAVAFDQAPAGAAESGIDAEDANRVPAHGPVDSPGLAPRLGEPIRTGYPRHYRQPGGRLLLAAQCPGRFPHPFLRLGRSAHEPVPASLPSNC